METDFIGVGVHELGSTQGSAQLSLSPWVPRPTSRSQSRSGERNKWPALLYPFNLSGALWIAQRVRSPWSCRWSFEVWNGADSRYLAKLRSSNSCSVTTGDRLRGGMRPGARKSWGIWPQKMSLMASVYFEVSISITAEGFVRGSLRYDVRGAGEYGREPFQEAGRVGLVIRGSHPNETQLNDNRRYPTAAAMSSTTVVAC